MYSYPYIPTERGSVTFLILEAFPSNILLVTSATRVAGVLPSAAASGDRRGAKTAVES